ncbi:RidA family protein [bacterium CPR1]|nr:RidA family protein [bacterium CPR1]
MLTPVNPESVAAPRGYSNGILTPAGRLLFVAGQVAWNRDSQIVSDDFATQFDQALANLLEVVKAAGGQAENVARLTIYVTDHREYSAASKQVGQVYRARMGRHYPAMTLVEVKALLEEGARVELEATAVL